MSVGTYNYTFKSVVFESVKVKSVKIKKSSEVLGWCKKSFVRRFQNDTFESVFFKSVEIESVVVSVHPLSIIFFRSDQKVSFGLALSSQHYCI